MDQQAQRTMITAIAVIGALFVLLMAILSINSTEQKKQETAQMQACVASGGSWTISPENDSLMECTK